MNLQQFAIFVVVYVVAVWIGNFLTQQLQALTGPLGLLGAGVIFLAPLAILYYAMRRFVFTRRAD